jgi:hypothetical protein
MMTEDDAGLEMSPDSSRIEQTKKSLPAMTRRATPLLKILPNHLPNHLIIPIRYPT